MLWRSDPESLRHLVHESCFHFELEHWYRMESTSVVGILITRHPQPWFPSPLGVRAVGTVAIFPVAPPPETFDCLASSRRRETDSHVSSLCLKRRGLLQRWRHGLHLSSTIDTRTGLRLESTDEKRTGLSTVIDMVCCAIVDIKLCSLSLGTSLYPLQ